ncbi:unnamed protein product, partial [Prorocentrum cordatum]
DLDDAELAEGTDSTDSSTSLLRPPASPRRGRGGGNVFRWYRAVAAGACVLLAAGALRACVASKARAGFPLSGGSDDLIGLVASDCDTEKEEVKAGGCYAKCSDLTGGKYITRAGPATCCKGVGAACLWIGNLKTHPSFNTRANTAAQANTTQAADGNVPHHNPLCEDWEERTAGACYTSCANLTNGTHTNRISALTCCSGRGLECLNPAKLKTSISLSAGGNRKVFGGDCDENEEHHMGLCYRSCDNLTRGWYPNRVAAETCCNGTGLSCLNPMNLKTDPSFGEGGGRAHMSQVCKSYEEHHGGLCYIQCQKLTNGSHPHRVAPGVCCKANGTACMNPANLLSKPWFAAGGGRWAPKEHGNVSCAETEESHLGMCYTKCTVLTEDEYPNRVAASTCCKTHGWSCMSPANLKTSPAFAAGGNRSIAASCKKIEELYGGMCYIKCSILTNGTHNYRLSGLSCCNGTSAMNCFYNPSQISTKSWYAAGGGRFATKAPGNSTKCSNPETEEHAGMCLKKCSLLTDGEFPYRVTVATCCKEKSLKCLQASYRKTSAAFGHRMDGGVPPANDEDPALQGIAGAPDEGEGPALDAPVPEATNQSSGNSTGAAGAVSLARAGGKSAPEEPTDEELDVWNRMVANASTHDGIDLASLGAPVSVVSQVVAGMIYDFTFSDGTVVSVFEQSWTDTLEVQDIVHAPPANGTGQQAGKKPGGFTVLKTGGWSAASKPTPEDLAAWENTVDKVGSYQDVDLASLGQPVLVQTKVVSGTQFRFVFEDGEVVTVQSQPWTNTLEVTSVEQPKTDEAYVNKTVSMMKPDWTPRATQTSAAPESTEAPAPTSTEAPSSTEPSTFTTSPPNGTEVVSSNVSTKKSR